MNAAALLDRLELATDRLNPIVVKELRQSLRARVFTGAFAGLLGLCVFVSLSMPTDFDGGSPPGQGLFAVYLSGLVIVALGVLPFNVFRSLAKELADESWPSLALTPLGARRIVRGRIASGVVQSALYASAVAPFLFFSYMLQGVGLTTIFVSLALVVLAQPLVTAFAVCAATVAQHKTLRGLLLLGIFFVLFGFTSGGIGLLADYLRSPTFTLDAEVLVAWAMVIASSVTLTILLAEVAAARIATTAENTARGPRLALLAHLAPPVLVALLAQPSWRSNGLPLVVLGYTLAFGFAFGAAGLGEAPVAPVAVRSTSRWSFLLPGRRGALRFAVVLTTAVAALLLARADVSSDEWVAYVAGPALVAIHLSIACVLAPMLPAMVSESPDARRVLPFVLVTLASVAPPLVGAIALLDPAAPLLNLLNPFVIAVNARDDDTHWVPVALLVLAPLFVLAADRVLAHEEQDALRKEAARA